MSGSSRLSLALGAAIVVLLLTAGCAFAGPTVTVRIEGETVELPATTVTLNAPEPVSGCPADSVAAAINAAVDGTWDHGEANGGGGDFTETILGETHAFTHESDTWAEWVNYKWGGGICTDLLGEGDEVLMVADHEPEPFFAPTVLPLVLGEVPAAVQAGVPFSVKVNAIHTPAGMFAEAGEGTPEPAVGATVAGGGVTTTSGAGGIATMTLNGAGTATLRATGLGDAPSPSVTVCVHNGNDGNCGTTAPSATGVPQTGAVLAPAPYRGPFALVSQLAGLSEGQIFAPGRAPRLLSGKVLSHSAVSSVSLELRRSYRSRCYAYDGVRAQFRRARCGSGHPFAVAQGSTWSYLLPAVLGPGRYVLDVLATDVAGNRLALARGSSRIVFHVR